MFTWYERSKVCYAYLSDVACEGLDPGEIKKLFRESEWFRRGWTLQELLAPSYVDFFSQDWSWIGSKSSLSGVVSKVTRIKDLWNWKPASVAQKMSWASVRETTRIEDRAYSLLGLFGVHMPPLYGEGENAFIRLQLEIMSKLDDDSLFAWEGDVPGGFSGLLAPSSSYFFTSADIVRAVIDKNRPPHSWTSKGIGTHFMCKPTEKFVHGTKSGTPSFLALLNCAPKPAKGYISRYIGLLLSQSPSGVWMRATTRCLFEVDEYTYGELDKVRARERDIRYIPQIALSRETPITSVYVATESFTSLGFVAKKRWPTTSWREFKFSEHGPWREGKRGNPFSRLEFYFHEFTYSRASLIFQNKDLHGFGLVMEISNGRVFFDVVTLNEAESTSGWEDWKESALIDRDRLSLPFLHGSLNARIYDTDNRHLHSNITRKIIELKFDPKGKLRWPRLEPPEQPRTPGPFNRVKDYSALVAENYREREYFCEYENCSRSVRPFNNRDDFREHLKDLHQEDVGGQIEGIQYWEFVGLEWWRCTYCLRKLYVTQDGWICALCNSPCEEERRNAREKLDLLLKE
jgi:hypothetical protein